MKTTHNRAERLGEQIRRSLGEILSRKKQLADFSFISITAVKASPDLSVAKVYITSLIQDIDHHKTQEELNTLSGFLRKELSQDLNLRKTPKLTFKYDESLEFANKMEKLIDKAIKEDEH